MNLLMIPALASIAALGFLVVAGGVAGLMMLDRDSAAAGRSFLLRTGRAVLAALVFAWAGLFLVGMLTVLVGDQVGMLSLWACGPAGFLVGFLWAPRKKLTAAEPESIDNAPPNLQ